jgi:acetyl/propionyl-CoA carboxylase alpha subunit
LSSRRSVRGGPVGGGGELASLPITLVLAQSSGRLRVLPPRGFRHGREWVRAGQPVARVEHGTDAEVILAPMDGAMGGVLARDGDPVQAGQPVVWLEAAPGPA